MNLGVCPRRPRDRDTVRSSARSKKDTLKRILISKGKYTAKYLFGKNNFVIYTELNKKYNILFLLLCNIASSTTCNLGRVFEKNGPITARKLK